MGVSKIRNRNLLLDAYSIVLIDNDTYGLDLSRNWSNSSLVLTRTQRPANAIPLNGQALWFDEKQNLIYCFGGFRTFAAGSLDPAPFESIWAFTPDGQGSGNWKEVLGPMGIQAFPSNILRPSDGGFCNDESSGYYIGGYVSSSSTRSVGREEPSNGLLTFRFNDLRFTNTSDGNYERSLERTKIFGSGKMVNIPKFGTGGIIILLGEGNPTQVISFNNITIYDKAEEKWYSQPASGALPEPRSDFCIVGIPGTTASNSFEM